ncbi:MAG: polysaccharide deacetylase family protein [Vicinamibacterales bacterium]
MDRDRLVLVQHHRVGWPPRAARYKRMFTTPALLAFQVRLLRLAGYRFSTLHEAIGAHGRRAVVTFDDGYRDNAEAGAAVLGQLGIPATVFVVSSDVGRTQLQWDESGDRLPADLMGWDDLRSLVDRGWEVGSHGHEHVHLARRPPEEQREIVCRGRDSIARMLGAAPQSFAYPYGSFTDATIDAVRCAGFHCAVTADGGANGLRPDPFRLRRQPGGGRGLRHFAAAIRLLL